MSEARKGKAPYVCVSPDLGDVAIVEQRNGARTEQVFVTFSEVPALCRALHEVAGLEWVEDDIPTPAERIYQQTGGATPELQRLYADFKANREAIAKGQSEYVATPKDPDRARTLAEAGNGSTSFPHLGSGAGGSAAGLEDRDFVPMSNQTASGFSAANSTNCADFQGRTTHQLQPAPDLTDLKAALEGLREAERASWNFRHDLRDEIGKPLTRLFLAAERAGLLTEDKPGDALEVAERALKTARAAMRSNGWQFAETIGDPGGKEAQDAYDAVDEALSALQRAKGGGE